MRILHGPQNIGGMAGVLARAERRCGIDASAYCLPTGNFQYTADRYIDERTLSRIETLTGRRANVTMEFFLKEAWRYDAFQFYFGKSYGGPGLLDVPLLKTIGKKIYFYFCGCDVRDSKTTIAKYRYNACSQCWPMLCSANRQRTLDVAQRYGDAIFVSTPDLLEFVPGSVLLPQPIDLELFTPIRQAAQQQREARRMSDSVRIAHAPSNQTIKGTKYLLQAVASLQRRGFAVELELIEGKSYMEAMQLCAAADIVVDQLQIGAYGQYAVEMMALGKPVVCYIREDLRQHYPADLPIVSANADTIEQVLADLIGDRLAWGELGARGVSYVEATHESVAVARKAIAHY